MKKKYVRFMMMFAVSVSMICGGAYTLCAAENTELKTEKVSPETAEKESQTTKNSVIEDGIYSAEFDTDSSMFHVNEAKGGRGILTVKDGKMTIHVSLASKGILNLFVGTAEDAQKEGAGLLEPTTDTVTYSDGWTEEVYGFDIPVPALDEEFSVALIGKKGKWYDHKVSVTDLQPETEDSSETTEKTAEETAKEGASAENLNLEDGSYTAEVVLNGGSGKASIESPALLTVKDHKATIQIIWSSSNYDYMLAGDEKYEPVNTEGNSTFLIPVTGFDCEMEVVADTIAMSVPHEISYTISIDSSSIKKTEQ